jgi:cytidylate kinase
MRISEEKVVALFGSSAVGKTTLARHLAALLQWPLRSCGSQVMELARERGLAPDQLPIGDHCKIDNDTLVWIEAQEMCVVDGRFLDIVLSPISTSVIPIRVTATDLQRQKRLVSMREGHDNPARLDAQDSELRVKLYSGVGALEPALTIDTTVKAVDVCINELIAFPKIHRLVHS